MSPREKRAASTVRKPARTPRAYRSPAVGIEDNNALIANHETRLLALETLCHDVAELGATVDKIGRYIRIWGPVIVTAAVSSGFASGRWGAFLSALFTGHAG